MASIQENLNITGKSEMDVYSAALETIPMAGLEIWKTREVARLVLGQGFIDDGPLRYNIAVGMVDASTAISAESKNLTKEKFMPLINKQKISFDKSLA